MEGKAPSDIDRFVGRRIFERRRELGLSQEALAERLRVTFQQVQKYERGSNRIAAGRLFDLAQALETSIPYFYKGLAEFSAAKSDFAMAEDAADFQAFDQEAVDALVGFMKIPPGPQRKQVLDYIRNAASQNPKAAKKNG